MIKGGKTSLADWELRGLGLLRDWFSVESIDHITFLSNGFNVLAKVVQTCQDKLGSSQDCDQYTSLLEALRVWFFGVLLRGKISWQIMVSLSFEQLSTKRMLGDEDK